MNLTLHKDWLEPGFQPATLTDSPWGAALPAKPAFDSVSRVDKHTAWKGSLESFAAELVRVLEVRLNDLAGRRVHMAVSGGYDSRILLALAERNGLAPLCCGDGTQEPAASRTLDYLNIPEERRYTHDLTQSDPYGLADAKVDGWAPLYFDMSFFPGDADAVLVTGIGGGEWFSYPAAGWHNGHRARTPRETLVDWWMDTWPQYWLLPASWAAGYEFGCHPYCTYEYAMVATRCLSDWLVETHPALELDAVREAMLGVIDPDLCWLGYAPHQYDWKLTVDEAEGIDKRFRESWLAGAYPDETADLRPSLMHHDVHACTIGGLATWCDSLIEQGHSLQ